MYRPLAIGGQIQDLGAPEDILAQSIRAKAARDAAQKAQMDLALSAQKQKENDIDLAQKALTQKELERTTAEDAARRGVLGKYLQNRDTVETAPVGVVNPSFLGKPQMGPQPQGYQAPRDISSLDRQAEIDLAKINPDFSEQFRASRKTETQGAEDRARAIAVEQATQRRLDDAEARAGRKLTDDEKQQVIANNLEWFKAQTERKNSEKGTTGSQRDVASLRGQLDKRAKTYLTVKDAYAQARKEYDNLAKNPTGADARANQQGIIDKYVTSSTGKATTQEQFQSLVEKFPGIQNYVSNFGGKISVGRPLPISMINGLMRNMRGYQEGLLENLKQANEDFATEAGYRGVDPRGLMLTPNERLDSDLQDLESYKYGEEENGLPVKKASGIMGLFGKNADETAISHEDQQALAWSLKNRNDPRAVKILQLHGVR